MKTDENNNTCLEICVTAQRLNILKLNLTVSIFIFQVLNIIFKRERRSSIDLPHPF